MGGLVFILILIFVIVPLVKKLKESMDEGNTSNRNRYGGYNSRNRNDGYNNPNVYNSQNNKKITYDWKPDYGPRNDQINQGVQNSQGVQGAQGSQGPQRPQNNMGAQRTQSSQSMQGIGSTQNGRNLNTASVGVDTLTPSTQANTRTTAPAVKISEKKTTAASIRKEIDRRKEADQTDIDNADGVPAPDMYLEHAAVMPEYNSLEYSAATYDVPESDAFKYSEIVIDSKVHVDAVAPDPDKTKEIYIKP